MSDSAIAFNRTIQHVQDRLSINSLNHRVISGNMANLNTPGYVAKETSFEDALRESIQDEAIKMVRSSGKHLDPGNVHSAMQSAELVETGPVDLDNEMVKLSRNSVEYQFMVTMLNKKFTMLRHAIEGTT